MIEITRIIIDENIVPENLLFDTSETTIILTSASTEIKNKILTVVDLCYQQNDWNVLYDEIIAYFINMANQLFEDKNNQIFNELNDLFVEIEWQLEDDITVDKVYFIDQVLTVAPVICSKIVYHHLLLLQQDIVYVDTRDLIITDNTYGHGIILEKESYSNIERLDTKPNRVIILADDIGSSTENYGVSLEDGTLLSLLNSYFSDSKP